MTNHRLFILLLFAIAGYITLALLSARFDPAVRWEYQLDREKAIARAREAAARFYGIDVTGWEPRLRVTDNPMVAFYLSRHPQQDENPFITPVRTQVLLVEPSGERRKIRVGLNNRGQAIGFAYRDQSPTQAASSSTEPKTSPEATQQTAEAALIRFVGGDMERFKRVSEVAQEKEGVRVVWEQTSADQPDLKLQIEGQVRGQTVREMFSRPVFAPGIVDEFNAQQNPITLLDTLNVLLITLTGLATLILFILAAARREINYRPVLILLTALTLLSIAAKSFTGDIEATLTNLEFDAVGGKPVLRILYALLTSILLPSFFYALGLALLWGLGLAFVKRANLIRYASFASLLKAKLLSRCVASRVAIGFLLGGLVAAVPYLVTASKLFSVARPEPQSPQLLVAPAPALAALLPALPYALFAIYGFLIPLFSGFIRAPLIIRALAILLGFFWLGESAMYQPSVPVALFAGGLLAIVVDQIYWRYDFLALMAAAVSAQMVAAAFTLLIQPSRTLDMSGSLALAGFGVLLSIALVVSWKGRETQYEDELAVAPLGVISAQQQAERERLLAEFGVARTAQQHMLPAAPPVIPGYTIAATCRPAREVGGDLYDFLVLPDERIGIVVADVSGKGVPAALYMTLTKGLLASIAENENDPGAILREVNRHLYQVCQRKVFVTMILGVLDPATRTFTYARAGHNPGIWQSAAGGNLTLLQAPGLGLGLASGKMFDRSLRPKVIQMESGDMLLFYSDGITEAMNAQGEEFGMDRLMAAADRAEGLNVEETRDSILAEVSAFLGETPPQDDITLVVIRIAE